MTWKVSPETNSKVSILANANVSLLTKSKVEMVNISEGGGGEEVERYCENIIFQELNLIFSDFSIIFLLNKNNS